MNPYDFLPAFMFLVLAALLFSGFPVALILGGVSLAFGLVGYFFDVFALVEFFNFMPRIWGTAMENLVLTAIPMFIFMGTMLEKSGIGADLLNCLRVMLRRVPGGLALSVTVMATILAAATGIVSATVIMVTLLALPIMLAAGYNTKLATGTIAASTTLGILIPPSIMLVMMGDLLSVSVGNLFLGAIFPGLVLSGLYFSWIVILCLFKPELAPPLPAEEGPRGMATLVALVLRSFIPPTFLIGAVLGSIFLGWATPTEASGVGAAGATLIALLSGRLTFAVMKEVVDRAALTVGMVFLVVMGASAFSYVFRVLGGDDFIIHILERSGLGAWGFLFIMMGMIFLLGFFFEWLEILLIVIPVFAPVVRLLDFGDHVAQHEVLYWFAILVAINLQTSFITPPFGFTLFYVKGAAPPGVTTKDIYLGIIPFVFLQLVGLCLVIYFPTLALYLPRLMFD